MKNENLLKLVTRSAIMFFVMLSLGLTLNAQVAVPDGVNYQAIARDAVTGAPLADQLLEVKALIYDGTTLIISEEFTVTTNGFGLFTLTIGTGVSWAAIADPMIEVQVFLGGVWESMGTVDVLSVPYAAVAGNVAYYDGSNLFLGDGSIIPLVPDGAPGVVEANKTVVAGPDKELATFGDFTIGGTATMTATVYMTHNADANSINSGTLQVDGGAGIAKNLFVGQALNVTQKAWVGNNNTVPLEIHGDGECLGGYTDGTLVVDGDAGFNYDVRMAADLYVLCGMIWGDLTGDVTGNVTGDLYGTADHALEANHALKADSAFHAIDANEALHALEADEAGHAIYSDTADYAYVAEYALSAPTSDTADYAYEAYHAENADWATNAGHAATADLATQAVFSAEAGHALKADSALHALEADYSLEGYHAMYSDTADFAYVAHQLGWLGHCEDAYIDVIYGCGPVTVHPVFHIDNETELYGDCTLGFTQGALLVDGGAGFGENVGIKGSLEVCGQGEFQEVVYIYNDDNATSINDGALVVDGGIGVAKSIFAGNKITALKSAKFGVNNSISIVGNCVDGYSDGTLIVYGDAGFNYNVYMLNNLYVCDTLFVEDIEAETINALEITTVDLNFTDAYGGDMDVDNVTADTVWAFFIGDLRGNVTGRADYADTADYAFEALHADSADMAAYAWDALHADSADMAAYAWEALHADSADMAAIAWHAYEADHATLADQALEAYNADTADIALQLGYLGTCVDAYINTIYGCSPVTVAPTTELYVASTLTLGGGCADWTGAFRVDGGAAFNENVGVKGTLTACGNITAPEFHGDSYGTHYGDVEGNVSAPEWIIIHNGASLGGDCANGFTGALEVNGGSALNGSLGVQGNTELCNNLLVRGTTEMVQNVLISDNTNAISTVSGALRVIGGVGIQQSLYVADDIVSEKRAKIGTSNSVPAVGNCSLGWTDATLLVRGEAAFNYDVYMRYNLHVCDTLFAEDIEAETINALDITTVDLTFINAYGGDMDVDNVTADTVWAFFIGDLRGNVTGRADYADTADYAFDALHADSADIAAYAWDALHADSADIAAYAWDALHADSADMAAYAWDALHADSADMAAIAWHAYEADHATLADQALEAYNADTADIALQLGYPTTGCVDAYINTIYGCSPVTVDATTELYVASTVTLGGGCSDWTGALRVDGGAAFNEKVGVKGDLTVCGNITGTSFHGDTYGMHYGDVHGNVSAPLYVIIEGGASLAGDCTLGYTGALEVHGGSALNGSLGVTGNTELCNHLLVKGSTEMEQNVLISDNTNAISITSGALRVIGGVGIGQSLYVADDIVSEKRAIIGTSNSVPFVGACGGFTDATLFVDGDAAFNYDVHVALNIDVCGTVTAAGGFLGDLGAVGDCYDAYLSNIFGCSNIDVNTDTLWVHGDLYVDGMVYGNFSGSFIGDLTGNVTGNLLGNVTGDVTGNVTGNLLGDVTGNVTGNLLGDVTGDVTGNVTGNLLGDVTGNVTGTLTGDSYGTHYGPVIGDVTGNLFGNVGVAGDCYDAYLSNIYGCSNIDVYTDTLWVHGDLYVDGMIYGNISGSFIGDIDGNVTGNLLGDVIGNVTGTLTGDSYGTHYGPVIGDVSGNLLGNATTATTADVALQLGAPGACVDAYIDTIFGCSPVVVDSDFKTTKAVYRNVTSTTGIGVYTVVDDDYIVISTKTVDLPNATNYTGRVIIVRNSGTGVISITCTAGASIHWFNPMAGGNLPASHGCTFASDGVAWHQISGVITP